MTGTLALALVVTTVSGAAQKGAPPDVPKNHWAYEAVDETYRLGLLVGYPNGTFNGSRPVSRYELAVATDKLDKVLRSQIEAHPAPTANRSADLASLKAQLDLLDQELAGLKSVGPDLASLRGSMEKLQGRLGRLKADTKALKTGLEQAKKKA